jgi:hypothetical protein
MYTFTVKQDSRLSTPEEDDVAFSMLPARLLLRTAAPQLTPQFPLNRTFICYTSKAQAYEKTLLQ